MATLPNHFPKIFTSKGVLKCWSKSLASLPRHNLSMEHIISLSVLPWNHVWNVRFIWSMPFVFHHFMQYQGRVRKSLFQVNKIHFICIFLLTHKHLSVTVLTEWIPTAWISDLHPQKSKVAVSILYSLHKKLQIDREYTFINTHFKDNCFLIFDVPDSS